MNSYIAYHFTISPLQPACEILIAELSAIGFEGFLEHEKGVSAYILKTEWHPGVLKTVSILQNPDCDITYRQEEIAPVNWNVEWEKHIDPVTINGICTIRAPFHPKPTTPFDVVITPKMSFGTGHHETTQMMVEWLLEEPLEGKNVLDMGCGTGVLAILAAKRGASTVDAIDTDAWSYQNALENVAYNRCENVTIYQGDVDLIQEKKYDLILANINRNVLLDHIPVYAACLVKNGTLLMSGFYEADAESIGVQCREHALKFVKNKTCNGWFSVKYVF